MAGSEVVSVGAAEGVGTGEAEEDYRVNGVALRVEVASKVREVDMRIEAEGADAVGSSRLPQLRFREPVVGDRLLGTERGAS